MIRVTVELIPHGNERRKTEIGRLEIANTGDHERRPEWGNYTARFGVIREGQTVGLHQRRILNFRRTRFNVWALIGNAIEALHNDNPEALELEGWADADST